MRRKNKKKSMLLVLLMLIAGISMGYAILNTTLNINGTSKIKDAKWNVYWDNPQVTTGSVTDTAPTIDSLKTTATFGVTLNNPKDYYEFTIDAVNAGTIDAMIKVNGVNNKVYSDAERTQETTLPAAISYTVTYADGTTIADRHLLAKKSGNTPTRETYKVRVEYREDISAQDLEEIAGNPTYYMSFNVEYVQADNTATESHPSAITYINRQVEGQITPGDVIGIGETEDFYVVSSDEQKTVLLAEYNLLVGDYYYYDEDNDLIYSGTINSSTPGYGLQSVNTTGAYSNNGNYNGGVPFSSTNYWMNGNNLLSPYNENDTIYTDSSSQDESDWFFKYRNDDSSAYPYVYDSNSNVYQYISGENGYVNRLKAMGAPSTITGRLLTYEEAESLSSEYSVQEKQDYWTGSALSAIRLRLMYEAAGGSYFGDYDYNTVGIRPVIEIPTSELQ